MVVLNLPPYLLYIGLVAIIRGVVGFYQDLAPKIAAIIKIKPQLDMKIGEFVTTK